MMIGKVQFSRWAILLMVVLFSSAVGLATIQNQSPEQQYTKAKELQQQGNYQDAAKLFLKVIGTKSADASAVAGSLSQIQACYRSLRNEGEIDSAIDEAIEQHGGKPEVLAAAAETLRRSSHYGYLVDGAFYRGYNQRQRVYGAAIQCSEQDRLRSMNLLLKAIELTDADRGDLYIKLADAILIGRNNKQAWRLQSLSDLDKEPDYTQLDQQSSFAYMDAPVDDEGNPIVYSIPDGLESAQSDGERYRWALEQANSTTSKYQARLRWANFLSSQFSVATLSQSFWGAGGSNKGTRDAMGQLHELAEDETIAKLADGIKRFKPAPEFNAVKIYKDLIEEVDIGSYRRSAVNKLANIYMNRRQYPKAAETIELDLSSFGDAQKLLDSIRGPQLQFDPSKPLQAGEKGEISMLFRNAKQVDFTIRRIDMEKLLT
ncbi:MAG: hypothetical protein AAF483_31320, partial [Planctomycetota bacterium]